MLSIFLPQIRFLNILPSLTIWNGTSVRQAGRLSGLNDKIFPLLSKWKDYIGGFLKISQNSSDLEHSFSLRSSYCASLDPPPPSFWVFKQVCSQTSVTTVNQDPEHNVWFSSQWTERNHAKLLQKKTKKNWFHLRSLIPILRRVIFFYFQNEKDQILTTNIWLNLVSTFFSLSTILGLNMFI